MIPMRSDAWTDPHTQCDPRNIAEGECEGGRYSFGIERGILEGVPVPKAAHFPSFLIYRIRKRNAKMGKCLCSQKYVDEDT
jgi:hypothetical protein